MQYKCPHCQARVSVFRASPGRPCVEKGACTSCGSKVVIGANGKRFAIVLPLLILCTWMAWGLASPLVFGAVAGTVLVLTVLQLNKAPPA